MRSSLSEPARRAFQRATPLLLVGLLAACGDAPADQADAESADATPAVAAPHVVDVVGSDYSYTMPDTLSAGATTFRLTTNGQELHHMSLMKLNDGHTLDELMTAMHAGPPPAWAQAVGGPNPPVPMAGTASVTVNLEPGSYAVVCFVPSPDGVEHFAKGMSKGFTVVAGETMPIMPMATDTMTLTDYDFLLGKPLTAGVHILQVVNTSQQPHEVIVAKLAPGATPEQLVAWIEKPDGPPPGEPMGGVAGIMPGVVNLVELNLTPGNYALICFIPDATDGKLHVEHGMMKQITVQ